MGLWERLRGERNLAERLDGGALADPEPSRQAFFVETVAEGLKQLGYEVAGSQISEPNQDQYRGTVRLQSGLELEVQGSTEPRSVHVYYPRLWTSVDFFVDEQALGGFVRTDKEGWEFDDGLKNALLEEEYRLQKGQPSLAAVDAAPEPATSASSGIDVGVER